MSTVNDWLVVVASFNFHNDGLGNFTARSFGCRITRNGIGDYSVLLSQAVRQEDAIISIVSVISLVGLGYGYEIQYISPTQLRITWEDAVGPIEPSFTMKIERQSPTETVIL